MTQPEKKNADKSSRRENVPKSKKAKTANTSPKTSRKKSVSYKDDLEKGKAFIAELESQLDLVKQEKENIAEETSHLKKKLSSVQHFDNLILEDISTAKDGFFILLYPSQGSFNCKIMRLYKKEKPKPIKGQDKATIITLISKYFPHLKKQAAQTDSADFNKKEFPRMYAERAAVKDMQSLMECTILQDGITVPFNDIRHDQPFQVQLNVDLSEVIIEGTEKDAQLDYKIFLYCKHLTGKPFQHLAELKGSTETSKEFTEIVESEPLSPGTYRLQTDTTISSSEKNDKAIKSFRNEYMLHVD